MNLKAHKTFGKLEPGDFVYTIEMTTQSIISYQIKSVKEKTKSQVVIGIIKLISAKQVDRQIIIAKAEELEKELPILYLLVNKQSKFIITKQIPPLVYSSDPDYLRDWMVKTAK